MLSQNGKPDGQKLFILGFMTGALMVGLMFFFKLYGAENGEANIFSGLKMNSPLYTVEQSTFADLPKLKTGIEFGE